MKVAIVGSRDYPHMEEVQAYVVSLPRDDTTIISGGARGVDRVAEEAAREVGLSLEIYPAEWEKYGRSAGYRRNHHIVRAAHIVVAFWNGVSRGAKHSIALAQAARKPLMVYQSEHETAITHVRFYNWEDTNLRNDHGY